MQLPMVMEYMEYTELCAGKLASTGYPAKTDPRPKDPKDPKISLVKRSDETLRQTSKVLGMFLEPHWLMNRFFAESTHSSCTECMVLPST